ncbi:MalY/PatB family protein [Nonomuraea sp. NPDC050663]|uniref:MalY/PatB family protein n=1 Tax=Nonomuraea sp. NPDC050663 TaxID=3364370 RepID=UPI003797FB9A
MKWSKAGPGVIPAWVADMDFPVAQPIREALERRAATDLGYPNWESHVAPEVLLEAFAERMESRYGWQPSPGHARAFTDLNQALQVVLHHVTEPGDRVALHTPAYNAFVATVTGMQREIVPVPAVPYGSGWRFELPDLSTCKVVLLLNPHNPTGRVFTHDELTELAEAAERHDLIVISDEIHADLTYAPHRHIPFATLLPERTITLTSASKAFNLGGVRCAVAHFGHEATRKAVWGMPGFLYGDANVFGVEATLAAWRHGDPWLEEVMRLLDRNRHVVAERLPGTIGYRVPEATYLAWLDFGRPGNAERLEREAGVLLSGGENFGPGGENHARLNFATSLPVLEEMLRRLT